MTKEEVVKWLESLKKEIGKAENRTLWHYAESIDMAIKALSAEAVQVNCDLISRQDAITEIRKYFVKEIIKTPHALNEDGYDVYTDMATVNSLLNYNKELNRRIKALPSADRPTWEWVEEDEYGDLWVCDQCGFANDYKDNYCPNCGVRMYKGGEEE